MTTQQYSNQRSGYQSQETQLTPAIVSSGNFGKVFSFPVPGHVYAEPLYMSQITMNDSNVHNVLFVATEQDWVYAFDADGKNPSQGYLWRVNLAPSGETYASYKDVSIGDIYPDIGITGTPVIDPNTGILYVVAKTKTTSGTVVWKQRLHALNISNGAETLNGPTMIQATVPGTGTGSSGGNLVFSALLENQRPGLLLTPTPNGSSPASIFLAFGSHGDLGSYHGWVISYSASDISQQTGAWASTPNGKEGGVWLAGGALSSDDNGDIYVGVGNGDFNANNKGGNYGDSAVTLNLSGSSLYATSYFTPTDQTKLETGDVDMGTGSLVLLPPQSGPLPNLLVNTDKSGELYLINRDALGGYSTTANASVQSFSIGYTIVSSVSFFNNTLYLAGEGGPLAAYAFNPTTQRFNTSATSTSSATFGCNDCGGAGAIPSISANGGSNAILWAIDNSGRESKPAILRAYDPSNLKTVWYDSSKSTKDTAAIAVKFTTPVIANGRVYVSGNSAVTVYGQVGVKTTVSISANPTSIVAGASSTLTVSASNATGVVITGSDGTSYTLSSTGGTQTVSPTATTTYTATASGSGGNVTSTAKVTVTAPSGCFPTTAGVDICSPTNNATTTSPVTITTGALAQAGNITSMTGFIDSVSVFTVNNPNVSPTMQTTQTLTVAPGGHSLEVVAYQDAGGSVQATSSFTVQAASSGPCTATSGVKICSPTAGSTSSSPITLSAGTVTPSGYITAIHVYIDSVKVASINNPQKSTTFSINQPLTVATGTHSLSVVSYSSTGAAYKGTETIKVQ